MTLIFIMGAVVGFALAILIRLIREVAEDLKINKYKRKIEQELKRIGESR